MSDKQIVKGTHRNECVPPPLLFLKSYVGSDIFISNILYLCCIHLLSGTASVHSQIQSISREPVFSDLLTLSIPLEPQFDDS